MSAKDATPSTSTSTPQPPPSTTADKPQLPQLLPLEDDDEFEEFKATDWTEEETYGATLEKKGGLDSLWDDNWDDDDIEDDFSTQLRAELAKQDQMQT